MGRFFQCIDDFFLRLESKWGLGPVSILTGVFLLGLAALFSSPRWELFYHGKGFSVLSTGPFDFTLESSLRYRILGPLLGYILFLKGNLFKYLMLAFLAVFHMLLYFLNRKRAFSPSESLGIGTLLSLSTLSFFQLYFPGYTDPISYVLILLILYHRENKWMLMICLTLLLFNHDNTLFLFPFLFLFILKEDYSKIKLLQTIKIFIPTIVLYGIYRVAINSVTEVDFDTSYYFDPGNLRWTWDHVSEHLAEGIFQAFRLTWLFAIIALYINIRERRFKEIILLFVCFVFVIAQFFIAYDISRLSGLAFPIILIGMWRIKEYYGSLVFKKLLWLIILLNFFIPSLCIGALEPIAYPPFWWPDVKEWIFPLI